MRLIIALCAVLLLAACQSAPTPQTTPETTTQPAGPALAGAMVPYYGNVSGYYVQSETPDSPGVVLIHEWWGLNDNIKQTADDLAGAGYNVLAVDLYHGDVAADQEHAMQYMAAANPDENLANLNAAASYLRSQGSDKVASWGYCFGGGQSANLALSGADIDATVIYYGAVPTNESATHNVTAPVFMVYGLNDTSTPAKNAEEFAHILQARDVYAELHEYPDVGHAFANPSNPGHDEAKTQDAWNKTLAFLNQMLKGSGPSQLAQE